MTVPGNIDALLLGGQRGYQIERSLRFNSADSANCNRSFSTPTNAKIGTFSFWCKRSKLGSGSQTILQQDTNTIYLGFDNNGSGADTFGVFLGGNSPAQARVTTQVFRDPSSWYHFIVAVDTTHGTASERLKVYVNGTQITAFSTSNTVSQNVDVFASGSYRIGSYAGSIEFFSGYLTEIHFIDGQALTPSSFGETDTITGVWKPKAFSGGSYGTNGFKLTFSDNSGTTSTTLGKDSSPNGNNFTPNNFSVTAGAGNDSLIDTPTPYADGGNGRGNYATLSPLSKGDDATLANGNLDISYGTATTRSSTMATMGMSTGKWYWEATITASSTTDTHAVIGVTNTSNSSFNTVPYYPGYSANGWGYYGNTGNKLNTDVATSYGNTFGVNDVIGCAFDASSGKIWWSKNGTWQASGDPAAGTNAAYTGLASATYFPAIGDGSVANTFSATLNFGQRAFAYTPPSGFLALNTQNLPEPSIKKPSSYFDTKLWTGNGTSQTISGLGFSPDLVWAKRRSTTASHGLVDSVRGTGKTLFSNLTDQEDTGDSNLTAFNSDGFTAGSGGNFNANGETYVGWCWDESATPGFDIVIYTGNATNRTIAHSLGVAPSMMIVKNRTSAANGWIVYHQFANASPATGGLRLNLTDAFVTYSPYWNNTAPTSSVFTVGTDSQVNGNTHEMVAYLWSEVAGFSKFGSYTGNGSTDGAFVYCGFRPRWVMIKNASGVGDWNLYDAARLAYNANDTVLFPNLSSAEQVNTGAPIDILSSGFKIRATAGNLNTSSSTYIFAAFAETPQKYSLAR